MDPNSSRRPIIASPLGEVLRAIRLHGTVYFKAALAAPWGMAMPQNSVANFHVVVSGRPWVAWEGETLRLQPGDIAVFPEGTAHRLMHELGAACVSGPTLLPVLQAGGRCGGDGPETVLICGHFAWDSEVPHPLFDGLPRALVVRAGDQDDPAWVGTVSELAVAESERGETGSPEVVDRLAEVLMIGVLRAWADAQDRPNGFLGALAEPGLARALSAMHQSPQTSWNLADLATLAGMSRTVFAERFRRATGWTPALYLTHWRMRRARVLLLTGMTLVEVADRVGYASEFGFAKAFKRIFGEGPGTVRRRTRP